MSILNLINETLHKPHGLSIDNLQKLAGVDKSTINENLEPAPDSKHKIKEKPYDHYKASTEENQEVKQVYRVRFDDQSEEYVELAKEEFVELKRLTPSHFIKSVVALDEKPEGVKLTTFAKVKKKADSLPDGEVAPHLTPEREKLKEVLKREIRKILKENGL